MCDVKVIKKKAKIRSLQKLPDIQYLKIYFLSIKVYSITGTSKCTNVDKPGKVKYDFYHILVRHPREPNVISILLSPVSMGKRQSECPLTFNLCLDEKSEMAVYNHVLVLTTRYNLSPELHEQYPGFQAKVDQILSSDCKFTKYIF